LSKKKVKKRPFFFCRCWIGDFLVPRKKEAADPESRCIAEIPGAPSQRLRHIREMTGDKGKEGRKDGRSEGREANSQKGE